jgi:hypothetical protein
MVMPAPVTASTIPVLTLGVIAVPAMFVVSLALARAPVLAAASMPMLALSTPARGRAERPFLASVIRFVYSIHYSDAFLSSRNENAK